MIKARCFSLCFLLFFVAQAQVTETLLTDELEPLEDITEDYQTLIDSSNTYYFEGNYRRSLEVNILLLKKALSENNIYNIHRGYRQLAYDYLAMNDTLLTKESFEKSEKYAKLSANDTATATTYMDMANLYATLKSDYETALSYHDKSIDLFKQIKDSAGLAKAHYNTILTALDAKDYPKAFLHLIKVKHLRDFEKHSSYHIGVESLFGEYYLAKENYEMADIYLTRAIAEAKEENLTVELEEAYKAYSKSLFGQKRFEEAYEAREQYEIYYKENIKNLTSAEVEAVSAKFQVTEYRKDVMAAELKNKMQAEMVASKSKLNRILIIVSTCAFLLLIGLLYAFRKRKKLVQLLRLKNREYLRAKKQSEKLARAKDQFFSTVSHELRTPLYGVIGLSTILMEDESLKSHEKDLKSLKFSADYLMALINDVLQINKIDSNKLAGETNNFNLRELFGSIAASFEYMRLQNNNKIHLIISDDIPKVLKGNSVRLSQILMNLVGNACKFTENGNIYIKAKATATNPKTTTIQFSVEDTGMGIAKDKFKEIFVEFSQLDSINYSYQGTGLGLPIVKKLLAQSNSKIQLESELGKGSTFSFSLSYECVQRIIKQEEVQTLDSNTLVGKNILIVEDNRINQTVTKKILEKNGIYCHIANNGKEAVEVVRKERFDLILMDLNMPVMNGFDATKNIREFNSTIPIIALTAVEIEEVRNEIYLTGMNDIIVKPYDVSKFIQTILKNINAKITCVLPATEKKAM
ncbi:MAG: response regulator [Bacteroidota bacterium]